MASPQNQMTTMDPNIAITVRVWHSPRADSQYPWKWAVQNGTETMEFGAEQSEADAKREATEARALWICILAGIPPAK